MCIPFISALPGWPQLAIISVPTSKQKQTMSGIIENESESFVFSFEALEFLIHLAVDLPLPWCFLRLMLKLTCMPGCSVMRQEQ